MNPKKSSPSFDLEIRAGKTQINIHVSAQLIRNVAVGLILGLTILLIHLTLSDAQLWADVLKAFLLLSHLILKALDENTDKDGNISGSDPYSLTRVDLPDITWNKRN